MASSTSGRYSVSTPRYQITPSGSVSGGLHGTYAPLSPAYNPNNLGMDTNDGSDGGLNQNNQNTNGYSPIREED